MQIQSKWWFWCLAVCAMQLVFITNTVTITVCQFYWFSFHYRLREAYKRGQNNTINLNNHIWLKYYISGYECRVRRRVSNVNLGLQFISITVICITFPLIASQMRVWNGMSGYVSAKHLHNNTFMVLNGQTKQTHKTGEQTVLIDIFII